MNAATSAELTPAGAHAQPRSGYLKGMVAVGRSARHGEYVVLHFGSGNFFCTDRLGALAIRALVDGRSDFEAIERVERMEAGSGERARRLIDRLATKGAMTRTPAPGRGYKSQLRRRVSEMMGVVISVLTPFVRLAPTRLLAWMFGVLPSTSKGNRIWRSSRPEIVRNQGASRSPLAKRPNPQRNYLFMYLTTVLPAARLSGLVDRLFDRDSADALAARLQAEGAMVGVFLHSPLCVAVPNALRIRGQEVVRVVVPCAHGVNVSEHSGPLRDFFGDSTEMAVELTEGNGAMTGVSGSLLRHLKTGRSVYVALDVPAAERKPAAEVEMLGQTFPRNDWPAWLAMRSGRPLALWTTHSTPSGIVISASPALYPNPSLPIGMRVADLSERLYALAEAAILEHPEAWTFLGYLHLLK